MYVNMDRKSSQIVTSLPEKPSPKTSRLVCLSDLHTLWDYVDVPPGDALLITGDITFTDKTADYYLTEFQKFLERQKQTFKDIYVIAGNHDRILERIGKEESQRRMAPATYLCNDKVVSSDGINIFGTPWSPPEQATHTAFQFSNPTESAAFLDPLLQLESGSVDILMSHAGPHGGHKNDLKPIVDKLKPRVNLSGHYHTKYGVSFIEDTAFINCATLNGAYLPVNPVVVIDIESKQ